MFGKAELLPFTSISIFLNVIALKEVNVFRLNFEQAFKNNCGTKNKKKISSRTLHLQVIITGELL